MLPRHTILLDFLWIFGFSFLGVFLRLRGFGADVYIEGTYLRIFETKGDVILVHSQVVCVGSFYKRNILRTLNKTMTFY